MFRKLLSYITAGYFLGLIAVGILLVRASPGPGSQDILGVGIGRSTNPYGNSPGVVYLSGRRLNCEPTTTTNSFTSQCHITIAEKLLTIYARRSLPSDGNQLGGSCEAVYDNRSWPCKIGSRHVHTHWFAYLELPLGLEPTQLGALRQQYLIENLPESVFLTGMLIVVLVTPILGSLCALTWVTPRLENRHAGWLISVLAGMLVFVMSCVTAGTLTRGFWD